MPALFCLGLALTLETAKHNMPNWLIENRATLQRQEAARELEGGDGPLCELRGEVVVQGISSWNTSAFPFSVKSRGIHSRLHTYCITDSVVKMGNIFIWDIAFLAEVI